MAFQCHYCPKSFTRRYNLNSHIKLCHPNQLHNGLSSRSSTNEASFRGIEKSSVPARASPCLEPLEPLESSLAKVDMYLKKLCPTKSESADVSETGRCSGSTSYVDQAERNVENKWTEKDVDVDTSSKKKKSNWGISLKEYKKKNEARRQGP